MGERSSTRRMYVSTIVAEILTFYFKNLIKIKYIIDTIIHTFHTSIFRYVTFLIPLR